MLTKKALLKAFAWRHRNKVAAAFLFGLLSICTTILIPVFLGKYYQIALHRDSARGKMFDVLLGHVTGLTTFFVTFGILVALKFVGDFFKRYYLGITGELLAKDTRERLFERQLNARLAYHQKKDTGLYLLRYSGDLSAIQNYLTKGIISFINDCLYLVLAVTVLAMLNLRLTLVLLASYPVIFGSILYLNKRLKILTRKRRNRRSNNLSFVSARLSAVLTIKAFNRQRIETDKYIKGSTDLYRYGVRYQRLYALIQALLPFMLYGMLVVVLGLAYEMKHTSHHKIHGHDLVTFIMTTVSIIPVMKRILGVNFIWQAGDISFTKLLRVYNTRQENETGSKQAPDNSGHITFSGVSFAFEGEQYVFRDLSFELPASSLALITGPNQSGKSTLLKLISGLYDPTSGTISIGKTPTSECDTFLLRKRVTIASDEFPLIGKTVFEAVSYSRKPEKRAPALAMLKALGYCAEDATDTILDSPIKESGRNISYSQRKILLLARAFLTNKKIIMLDEPFEGLDDTIVQRITTVLHQYRKKHTILIVGRAQEGGLDYDLEISLKNKDHV